MKKFLSLLMMALLCVTTAWGAKYVKVTLTTDLTSEGSYLIVCEEGSVAFDSNLEDLDVAHNNKEVEISDDQIDVQDANNLFYFRIYNTENGYTIKDLQDRYIGRGGDSNGLTTSESPLYNSISINSDGDAEIISSGGAYLRYNATSGQERFRYFKSTTYNAQKAIQLYKYVDDTPQAEYSIYRTITAQNPNDGGGWLGNWTNCSSVGDYNSNPTSYEVKAINGSEVIFTAGANSGYEILPENVTVKDANNNDVAITLVSTDGNNKEFKFTMPASDVTISAYFTFYRPTLRMAGRFNGRSGWVTGNSGPTFKYTYKDENNNTVVDNYTLDVYFSGNDNYFFFRADNADLKAANGNEANYGLNENNLNGTHSLGGGRNFQIIPGLYTFTINGDRTQLNIARITPTITFNPEAGTVELGTTVTATSTLTSIINAIQAADPGEDGVDEGAQGSVTVQVSTDGTSFSNEVTLNNSGDQTVFGKAFIGSIPPVEGTANYTVKPYYDITCAVVTDDDPTNTKGGIITADKQTAPAGETVTLTITTKSGYELDCVKLNGTAITGNTFVMPAADANVVAYFTAKTLNITVNNDDAKGVVSGVPATSTVGSEIEFTVTPHTGYTVNSVTYGFTPANGATNTTTLTAGENNTYSFKMPGYDVTIDVTYDEVIEGLINPLFHETFGTNPGGNREWSDNYSVKSGVEAVYSGITSYTVNEYVRQGSTNSGIEDGNAGLMGTQNQIASIIMGPLNVADYQSLLLSYQWKAGSTKGTYNTHAYYATSADGEYTEVEGTGNGASSYVLRSYTLPAAAEVSTLYLKIEFFTSNTQPYIDEVNLSGAPKRTTLKQIEETNPTGEVTIADDLQVVYIVPTKNVAFARDFAESNDAVECPAANATGGATDPIDFMRYGKIKDNPQANAWKQNNWVMLDFSQANPSQFGNLSENCVIKGGTLKGTYSDYTFMVSNFTYDADYNTNIAVGEYEPNVYSPANFYSSNTQTATVTIEGENGPETVERTYWFMTPKVMEVCKFTWAMYYSGNYNGVTYKPGFYMQEGDIPLKGGIGADMTYNYAEDEDGQAMNLGLDNLTPGASYRFLGVIMTAEPELESGAKDDPNNHHPQDGSIRNDKFKVATLNLNPEDESQVITGVSEVKTGSEVVSVTYCDLAGRMSQKPFAGVNIIVTRYSDGTVKTTKAIK